jgi:hypothetical protein
MMIPIFTSPLLETNAAIKAPPPSVYLFALPHHTYQRTLKPTALLLLYEDWN